jgi:hypothetical protein
MRLFVTLSSVLSILIISIAFGGTTGKIDGTVTDAKTGEKLVSVNIIVQGTKLGAVSNADGYFAILNVSPGTYTVQATLLGYATKRFNGAMVQIDQTTTLDFKLTEETVQGEEVTVVAERPVVQRDVSASVASISATEIQKLPTASITGVVGLQAGVQGAEGEDLIIRGSGGTTTIGGGGSDRNTFVLNGQVLRDSRDNAPYTGVSLSSLENIQVITGGWNAEYGNVRSGLVQAVTREGSSTKYTMSAFARYSPVDKKHFGPSPHDVNSYFIRPFVDPAVCWTGTQSGAWDTYTQRQYVSFNGWNNISQATLQDNDPENDLTPEAAQRLFLWQHRRQAELNQSDYDIDASVSGPLIPDLSEDLGDLRFLAAYRRSRNAYIFPLSSEAFEDEFGQLKLTADVMGGMKVSVEGFIQKSSGTNSSRVGGPGLFRTPASIASSLSGSFLDTRVFAPDYWSPGTERRKSLGMKLTHTINSSTFYNVVVTWYQTRYNTGPGRLRNNARIYKFGNSYYVDEAPFGFQPLPLSGNYDSGRSIDGMRMGAGGMSNSRDATITNSISTKADFTAQLDAVNQFQVGGEFVYTELLANYGDIDLYLPSGRSTTEYRRFPKQAAAYIQDKLEFEGMVANIGIRMDYSAAGGAWFSFNPYDRVLGTQGFNLAQYLPQGEIKPKVNYSPRLGVAFPISVNSKLFFNYGHFRSLPLADDQYQVRYDRTSGKVYYIANPENPLPRTIQYELGYEHNLFDELLLRLAGYYKDISQETKQVTYSDGRSVGYSTSTPNQYRDIRGFEVTLTKNRGQWVQGFINYTYEARSTGFFGYASNFLQPIDFQNYLRTTGRFDFVQAKPLPQPFGRVNVDFFTPEDFGPGAVGMNALGDWRINLLGTWRSGLRTTWDGTSGSLAAEANNVQWRDVFLLDARVSKAFRLSSFRLELFADITNLLDLRTMTDYGFVSTADRNAYMESLHLSSDIVDQLGRPINKINGSDKPGDYRKEGVEFQPMIGVEKFSDLGSSHRESRPFYYVREQGKYYQYVNGSYREVDAARLQQVLDDKAYIDMPNFDSINFLDPRNIFFGARLSFDF